MESLEHMLLLCDRVNRTWFASPLMLRITDVNLRTVEGWLLNMWNTLHDDQWNQALLCNILWFLWKGRCSELYDHRPFDPGGVLTSASFSTTDLWKARGWLIEDEVVVQRVDVQQS